MTQRLKMSVTLYGSESENETFLTALIGLTSPTGYQMTDGSASLSFATFTADFTLSVDPVQVFVSFATHIGTAIASSSYTAEVCLTRDRYEVLFN